MKKKNKKPNLKKFIWITHDGRYFNPDQMASGHLYHCIRMLFNNVMPPALRIKPTEFIRWRDVKYWSREYLEEAAYQLTKELMSRPDYEDYRDDIEDMAFNADLYLRLCDKRVLMVELAPQVEKYWLREAGEPFYY